MSKIISGTAGVAKVESTFRTPGAVAMRSRSFGSITRWLARMMLDEAGLAYLMRGLMDLTGIEFDVDGRLRSGAPNLTR